MVDNRSLYRVFISSPSDCEQERDIAETVIHELNNDPHLSPRMKLQCLRYEKNVPPTIEKAQPAIDAEIGQYELYVGILANRFGTPTGRWGSGTEHEFHLALEAYKAGDCKRLMFYFSTDAKPCATVEDCRQRRQVIEFKDRLSSVLYREYTLSAFREHFATDLARALSIIAEENTVTLPRVLDFVGRGIELRKLNEYLSDDSVAICGVIAGPGTGKTTLVSHWIDFLNSDRTKRLRKCIRSFAEPEGSPSISVNDFVTDALARFGFNGSLSVDAAERAKLLTDIFYEQPGVMVLDGLEPFAEWRRNEEARNTDFVADVAGLRDRVTRLDDVIKMLIQNIQRVGQRKNNRERLVVITSREPLSRFVRANAYRQLQLQGLRDDEGAKLLRNRGLCSSQENLENASYRLSGHPLALVLFPQYVKQRYGDDVSRALDIDDFFSEILFERMQFVEKWARIVIAYYSEKWTDDHPQKIVLEMMSLVHRDLKTPEFDALVDAAELARPVKSFRESDWQEHYAQLEEGGLLLRQEGGLKGWNCHPVIRSCMRENLRRKKPDLWRDAHSVLFEHFNSLSRPKPSTPEELFNVYRAITHGCHAGRYDEAYKIYNEKCLQGRWDAVITNKLGSFADDAVVLRLLSGAGTKQSGLSDENRAIVYGRLAFCYTCLGWLGDAISARHEELGIWKSNPLHDSKESMKQYAASAGELSSVYLYRGSLPLAERYAEDAIKQSDESGDWWTRMRSRARKAMVEYIKNHVDTAQSLFEEAEEIQSHGDEKKRPILYAEEGWFYNMFLLDTGRKTPGEVEDRCRKIQSATQTDHGAKEAWVVLDGLNLVALAVALLKQKKAEGWEELKKGLYILHKANSQVHLVAGLLRQAHAYISDGQTKEARHSINEAIKITDDHELPYYRANAYIQDTWNAITCIAKKADDGGEAKEYFQQAVSRLDQIKHIVRDCSYFLREAEVSNLEQKISQVENERALD